MQSGIRTIFLSALLTLPFFASASSYHIIVDISKQHLTVFDSKNNPVFGTVVITGSARNPTPIGSFHFKSLGVDSKKKKFAFPRGANGEYYASNVWAVFYRDKHGIGYGVHDSNWWPGWNESQAYALRIHQAGFGSHGCVNVPDPVIWKLLPYLSKGARITIQK